MYSVTLYYNKSVHTSRLMTGFHMLEQARRIQLKTIENTGNFRSIPYDAIQVEIAGKTITFDMSDRWCLMTEEGINHIRKVDVYFARSYSSDPDERLPQSDEYMNKVKPFGFDYYATYPGNPMDQKNSVGSRLNQFIRNVSGYEKCMYVPYFEGKADKKEKDFRIIFMTRLWNPDDINPDDSSDSETVRQYKQYMIEERHYINDQRIKIIRELKNKFGNSFTGGIHKDDFSIQICPDLVLNRSKTRKKAYIDAMKSSDICISTMGLHKSIGWKTGEFVAAARAIIAEKFLYDVPGNFDDGNHYISFHTADECLSAVESLYNDPDRVYAMKKANELYYQEFLKPDQQIVNALKELNILL